jgi:DNA-binding MarR family transcriptional regulator
VLDLHPTPIAPDDLGHAIDQLLRSVDAAHEGFARRENMHPTDFRALILLDDVGQPLSPKDIAHHLGLTSGSTTALLDRLESAGHIQRMSNPNDRRGILIRLASGGSDAISTIRAFRQEFQAATAALGTDERKLVVGVLTTLASLAERLIVELKTSETRR